MNFSDFTKLYSVSKTLRFELIPQGRTLENINKSDIIADDEHRDKSFSLAKKIIDEYHKSFIERVLCNLRLPLEGNGKKDSITKLYSFYRLKNTTGDASKKKYEDTQAQLRKIIKKAFNSDPAYSSLFTKDLIEKDIINFINGIGDSNLCGITKGEARDVINEFQKFTTYFVGFNDNRRNMYSEDSKSTAIAFRIINENFPKFVDNIEAFSKVAQTPELQENIKTLYREFEDYLNVASINEIFTLEYFNMVLSQSQIDLYNGIIGGRTEKDGRKIQGLNEYINLYNQKHKNNKLPKLRVLYKQILSDRVALSWLPEEFKYDNEVISAIRLSYENLNERILGEKNLKALLESVDSYNLERVYITNDLSINTISKRLLGQWGIIKEAIIENIKKVAPSQKRKEDAEAYRERINSIYNKAESFSLKYINDCLKAYGQDTNIATYFSSLGAINTETEQRENLFAYIDNKYADVASLLNSEYPKNRNLTQDKENVENIKCLLDSLKDLQAFIKPLLGKGDESDKDEAFYGEFSELWEEIDQVTPLYNKVRNYLTRKPYTQDKIKLNFQNVQLLSGWDENKIGDCGGVILRRNGLYYLAIINRKYRADIAKQLKAIKHSSEDFYENVVYKLLPDPKKMLPKVFIKAKKNIGFYKPSKSLLEKYKSGTHKQGDNFSLEDCHSLINYFKESIAKHPDWSKFGFQFTSTSEYNDINEFYNEVEGQGYKLTFSKIPTSSINEWVDNGKIFLFQIYNKDFSSFSKGTPNMHTLYWKALFNEDNLSDVVYKLNGNAEVFFRRHSITVERPTHPANQPIKNKNAANRKKESLFSYDLIKDRRYTVDKFMFHVPITMNFKSNFNSNSKCEINSMVRKYLTSAEPPCVIGIDRGERHLLYLTVVDCYGNILEQFSLNNIESNNITTNYHNILDTRESERQKARMSWQTIENIKDLKDGYLSQVVHIIAQLMIKHNAIVVLEDLNSGFIKGRQKVEKQVYKNFEKMLITKLNYLVDKKAEPKSPGGVMNALQLTESFESFQKLGKHSGFLFYVPAWNTSKIDPATGFVNLLDTRYKSIEASRGFFSKFDIIRFVQQYNWFEFHLDYSKFGTAAEGTRTKWVVTTHGDRIVSFRNPEKNSQWDSRVVDLTAEFKALFEKYNIDILGNLKEGISFQTQKDFFEELLHLLRLTLQMRNSITNSEVDYLISPVADKNGHFYDSRTCPSSLPKNADANGAYNIARKGLMLIQQLRKAKADNEDLDKVKFDITNKSWLNFAQKNDR